MNATAPPHLCPNAPPFQGLRLSFVQKTNDRLVAGRLAFAEITRQVETGRGAHLACCATSPRRWGRPTRRRGATL